MPRNNGHPWFKEMITSPFTFLVVSELLDEYEILETERSAVRLANFLELVNSRVVNDELRSELSAALFECVFKANNSEIWQKFFLACSKIEVVAELLRKWSPCSHHVQKLFIELLLSKRD